MLTIIVHVLICSDKCRLALVYCLGALLALPVGGGGGAQAAAAAERK
jgi:hypothetical protein